MSTDPLEALASALEGCHRRVMADATQGIAAAGLRRLDQGFIRSVDIAGKRYQLPKDAYKYGPPMIRTGKLRGGYLVRVNGVATGNRITFYNPVSYADHLIYGTKNKDGSEKMAPRQHMPKPEEAPPADLDRAFERAGQEALERYWRGVQV